MIFKIENTDLFRQINHQNWQKLSDFWLNSPANLKKIKDVFFLTKIKEIISKSDEKITLLDLGCGDAWLLEVILDNSLDVSYIGLDFNQDFISSLNIKYNNYQNVHFIHQDILGILPAPLINCADIVVSCFSMFEIPDLYVAFQNINLMLKKNASFLILTIDPLCLMLALNDSMEQLKQDLSNYEKNVNKSYCSQKIDLQNSFAELEYNGILYSLKEYFTLAKKFALEFQEYDEIIKTSDFFPKICNYLHFKKNEL